MQGLKLLTEVPGYKAILKAVIQSQIQTLVNQLAEHTGEESVLISASVDEGTLTHLGSDFGKVFLDGREEIKAQFLGFCLKRKQVKHTAQLTDNSHTRKRGPTSYRGKPLGTWSGNQRHKPYPVTFIKNETLESLQIRGNQSTKCGNQSDSYGIHTSEAGNQNVGHSANRSVLNGLVSKRSDQSPENQSTGSVKSHSVTQKVSSATSLSTASITTNSVRAPVPSGRETKSNEDDEDENEEPVVQMELVDGSDGPFSSEVQGIDTGVTGGGQINQSCVDDDETDTVLTDSSPAVEQGFEPQSGESTNQALAGEKLTVDTGEGISDQNVGNFEYTLESSSSPAAATESASSSHSSIGTVTYSLSTRNRKSTRKSADPKKRDSMNLTIKIKAQESHVDSNKKSNEERKSDLENFLYQDHTDRPYPCNMCPKRFKERHHLIYHIRTHSGHRPYKCPICGKGFTQSSSLNTHKRTHWKDINCQKCGKVFRKQAQFCNHTCFEETAS